MLIKREPEQSDVLLAPRTMGSILNETFAIYAKQIWRIVVLVAIVQVPVNLLTFLIIDVAGWGSGIIVGMVTGLGLFASAFVYGATVVAVGQHYASGRIDVSFSYAKAWWRIVSLFFVSLIIAVVFVVIPGIALWLVGAQLAVLVYLPLLVLGIYWLVTVQVVTMENLRAVPAFQRSMILVRGNWLRVFGTCLVLALVVLGFGVVLTLPFALVAAVNGAQEAASIPAPLAIVARIAVETLVPPILFIAGTLVYYDLRVRKEQYDVATLSQELGLAGA